MIVSSWFASFGFSSRGLLGVECDSSKSFGLSSFDSSFGVSSPSFSEFSGRGAWPRSAEIFLSSELFFDVPSFAFFSFLSFLLFFFSFSFSLVFFFFFAFSFSFLASGSDESRCFSLSFFASASKDSRFFSFSLSLSFSFSLSLGSCFSFSGRADDEDFR